MKDRSETSLLQARAGTFLAAAVKPLQLMRRKLFEVTVTGATVEGVTAVDEGRACQRPFERQKVRHGSGLAYK